MALSQAIGHILQGKSLDMKNWVNHMKSSKCEIADWGTLTNCIVVVGVEH